MVQERRVLYLVDGSSYVHRAYHALRHLSNSKGFPTNAVFGFSKMILKLLGEKKPQYLGVVFDAKGPTFRHALYEGYKATRPPTPEDLTVQIPYIRSIVKGLNLVMIEKEGFEADDVIGTLARVAEASQFDVVVITGDKDFRQIISPHTSLWDPMKDKFTDYATFLEEYGIRPDKIVDMMGLSGDVSDNIPGVPGIGEKTAAELIREYRDLEGVYGNLHAIKKKRLRENLEKSYDDAVLSKKLAAIDCFVPLDYEIEALKMKEPDVEALSAIFREMEFRDLWDQFNDRKESREKDYRLAVSEQDLLVMTRMIKEKGLISLDIRLGDESSLRSDLAGLSLCWEKNRAFYVPLSHRYPEVESQLGASKGLTLLKDVLEDGNIEKTGHDLKRAALILRYHGIELRGLHFDTMIASYVINPGLRQHDLGHLSQRFLNQKLISYQDLTGKGKDRMPFSRVEAAQAKVYSCELAETSLQLEKLMEKDLRTQGNEDLFRQLEMRLIPVLLDMEWAGIRVDTPFFMDLSRRFTEQLRAMESEIYEEAGMEFNIHSSQQLAYVLFEKLQLPVQKKTTRTRNYSTDVTVLTKLSHLPYKIPGLLLKYRTLSKLQSTYLDALVSMVDPATGRIHTSFNQTVTATGRLSSSDPNLQNIPVRGEDGREIRKGFVAEEGWYLLSADYSQIELRIFAHYSRDAAFIEAFNRGEDIHTRTASEILGVPMDKVTPEMRRIAKAINFGIIYGMGPQTLAEGLGIDLKRAKDYISAYYERYQGVARYREEVIGLARDRGYVTTLFNRRRYLPDINHHQRVIRAEAERMAINTPIQGTAADLIKKAMIRIHALLKKERVRARMLLQLHDELLFEVPEEEIERVGAMVKEEMESVYELHVPLKVAVNVGKNWDEAH
jgi:DNA polymerase-1